MALQRKITAAAVAAPNVNDVNFGDLGMYTAGASLPEGNYAIFHEVMMWKPPEGQYSARLGVMLTCHSLTDASAEPKTKFLSMGTKAHEAFAPNPDTGKGIVMREGGTGTGTLSKSSNWGLYLKSLYDSGLPQGIFRNDVSVLDGLWGHIANVPEPEERRGFRSNAKTSEVAEAGQQMSEGPKTTPCVTEILDDGRPWEGGGGMPKKGAAVKPNGKAPAAVTTTKATPAPAPTEEGISEEDLMEAALTAITSVLEKNADGVSTLQARSGAFKAATATYGDEVAQAVIETFFGSDEALNKVVEQLGYTVKAKKIVPQ